MMISMSGLDLSFLHNKHEPKPEPMRIRYIGLAPCPREGVEAIFDEESGRYHPKDDLISRQPKPEPTHRMKEILLQEAYARRAYSGEDAGPRPEKKKRATRRTKKAAS